MSDYCVVVADYCRARFFTLEPAKVPEVESGPNLVERSDLVNPDAGIPGRDKFSNAKSGRNTAPAPGGGAGGPGGGPAHGYDDHRDRHDEELERRFAKRIADTAIDLARQNGTQHLVLVAANRMLGFLREAVAPAAGNLEIREAAKDLTSRNALHIHRHLAEAGVLPARENRAPNQWHQSSGPGSGSNWSG